MAYRITALELAVLDHVALNSYQPTNYGRPDAYSDTGSIWSASITDSSSKRFVAPKQLPGVVSSLVKKGLVRTGGAGTQQDPGTLTMTESGFETWRSATADDPREPRDGEVAMPTEDDEPGMAADAATFPTEPPAAPAWVTAAMAVPTTSIDEFRAARAIAVAEYANLLAQIARETADATAALTRDARVSTHDAFNLAARCQDLQGIASRVKLLDEILNRK